MPLPSDLIKTPAITSEEYIIDRTAYPFTSAGMMSLIDAINEKNSLMASRYQFMAEAVNSIAAASGEFSKQYLRNFSEWGSGFSTTIPNVSLQAYTTTYFTLGCDFPWEEKFAAQPIRYDVQTPPTHVEPATADDMCVVYHGGEPLFEEDYYYYVLSGNRRVFLSSAVVSNEQNVECRIYPRRSPFVENFQEILSEATDVFVSQGIPVTAFDKLYKGVGNHPDFLVYYKSSPVSAWKLADPYRTSSAWNASSSEYVVMVSNLEIPAGTIRVMNNSSGWEIRYTCSGWRNVFDLVQENEVSVVSGDIVPTEENLPLPCSDATELLVLVQTTDETTGAKVTFKLVPYVDYIVRLHDPEDPAKNIAVVLKQQVKAGSVVRIIKTHSDGWVCDRHYQDILGSDNGYVLMPTFRFPISHEYTDITVNNRHIHATDWKVLSDKAVQFLRLDGTNNIYIRQAFHHTAEVVSLVDAYRDQRDAMEKWMSLTVYPTVVPITIGLDPKISMSDYVFGTSVSTNLSAEYWSTEWDSHVYSRYYRFSLTTEYTLQINIDNTEFNASMDIISGFDVAGPILYSAQEVWDTQTLTLGPGDYLIKLYSDFSEYTAEVP